jgi:excinuclease UvrABC nuclease subunit
MDSHDDAARIQACINEYCRTYAISPPPELSAAYDLDSAWLTESIPNAERQGCYFIFDRAGGLLYLGKASLGSTIGRRVATYFFWDKAGERLAYRHSGWTREPALLRTASVVNAYEAASLEEYLIGELRPCDNTRK